MNSPRTSPDARHLRHLALVERGKQAALAGDHGLALECYRTGLRMAQALSAPPLFARHYTDCILDSLEKSGHLESALALCERACGELAALRHPSPWQQRDRATLLLRQALQLLRLERLEEADQRLEQAVALAAPGALPLAEELRDWRARALTLRPERLDEAQSRHGYFTVRRDALKPELARQADIRLVRAAEP